MTDSPNADAQAPSPPEGLNACPFCGGGLVDACCDGDGSVYSAVMCDDCGARGPSGRLTVARAIEAWNKRVTDARPPSKDLNA